MNKDDLTIKEKDFENNKSDSIDDKIRHRFYVIGTVVLLLLLLLFTFVDNESKYEKETSKVTEYKLEENVEDTEREESLLFNEKSIENEEFFDSLEKSNKFTRQAVKEIIGERNFYDEKISELELIEVYTFLDGCEYLKEK